VVNFSWPNILDYNNTLVGAKYQCWIQQQAGIDVNKNNLNMSNKKLLIFNIHIVKKICHTPFYCFVWDMDHISIYLWIMIDDVNYIFNYFYLNVIIALPLVVVSNSLSFLLIQTTLHNFKLSRLLFSIRNLDGINFVVNFSWPNILDYNNSK
ncbi:hypothetical protein Mgra_00006122, partial [Meloidogyne graminicola]